MFHDSVEELPLCIPGGFATSVQTGAFVTGGVSVTVTVAVQVTEPPEPVAVPVYIVVFIGDTDLVPASTGVTKPMSWSIENDVASLVLQESVEEPPL